MISQLAFRIANARIRRAIRTQLTLESTPHRTIPPPPDSNKRYLLYIHVPFCHTICTYCSFNRFLFQEEKARRYFRSLRQEIALIHSLGYKFNAIYVGGGTTSILLDELLETLRFAKGLFPEISEISCESDPNHIDVDSILKLQGVVNRLSIGVQSFDDEILRKIGRYEKFGSGAQIRERLEAIRGLLPIVSVDLMFNFPGQSEEQLREDLRIIKAIAPTQITTYPLMSSPSISSALKASMGAFSPANQQRFYDVICENLLGEYVALSSWAFSKNEGEIFDEYIADNDEYVGVGSGSFSFVGGVMYVNTFSLREYSQWIGEGGGAIARVRHFDTLSQMQYRLMVGLFARGVSREWFRQKYGIALSRACFLELALLRAAGYVRFEGDLILPTKRGQYLFLDMMKEFYIGMDHIRELSRARLKSEDM